MCVYTIAFIQSFVALQDVSCMCEYEQLCMKIRYKKYTFFNILNSMYYIQDSIERDKERKRNGRHWGKSFPNSVCI